MNCVTFIDDDISKLLDKYKRWLESLKGLSTTVVATTMFQKTFPSGNVESVIYLLVTYKY